MNTRMKVHIKSWYIPCGLILLNVALKLPFLSSRDIALDEPFTIFWAQADFSSLFKMLKTENNPPLYFFLVHYWIKLFGISAFSVRLLPMLFSAGTVVFIYETVRRSYDSRTGIAASLIFTFSNYHLLFAHESRAYALFAFLTAISMFLFVEMYRNPRKKTNLVLLTVINILLIYTHFFGFFVLFIQLFSCVVISELRFCILKKYFLILVPCLLSYIPYIPIFFSRFHNSAAGGTWVLPPVISDLYTMLWRYSNAPVITVFYILILTGASIKFFFNGRKAGLPSVFTRVILIWFIVPYLTMFFISFLWPVFLDRYTVFISLGFYLLVAISVRYLGSNKIVFYTLSIAAVVMMATTFQPNLDNKRRIREVVAKVKELKTDETIVIVCPAWLDKGFTYYYNPEIFKNVRDFSKNLNADGVYPINHLEDMDPVIFQHAASVVFFEEWSALVDPRGRIPQFLDSGFTKINSWKICETFNISYYLKRAPGN